MSFPTLKKTLNQGGLMRKLFLITLTSLFLLGSLTALASYATEQPTEQPGPTIKKAQEQAPAKPLNILRLEMQLLQNKYDEVMQERSDLLKQVNYLEIRLPIVNNQLQQLQAQMKKKNSEIQKATAEEGKSEEPKEP